MRYGFFAAPVKRTTPRVTPAIPQKSSVAIVRSAPRDDFRTADFFHKVSGPTRLPAGATPDFSGSGSTGGNSIIVHPLGVDIPDGSVAQSTERYGTRVGSAARKWRPQPPGIVATPGGTC